jgi:hypothetical protein
MTEPVLSKAKDGMISQTGEARPSAAQDARAEAKLKGDF